MSVDPPAPIASPPSTLSTVTSAIRSAAKATGASFDYLLATAKVESDLNPSLSMQSSSATGLFQFIEQTWLEVMKQAGSKLGLGRYADAITETKSGRYEVTDPTMRAEIMQLRKDPAANAALGGVFTQQNAAVLANRIGRPPTDGELYIAHFFGPYSAAKVITMAGTNPTANAAQMFPAAARANRSIFYDRQGNARSVAGVYQELVRRYQSARARAMPEVQAAAASTGAVSPSPPPKPYVLPEVAAQTSAVSDTAGVTQAFSAANGAAASSQGDMRSARRPAESGSMFLSLFQTGERRGAVSPAVAELWGNGSGRLRGTSVDRATAFAATADANARAVTPLDLFQDMPPNARGLFDGGK